MAMRKASSIISVSQSTRRDLGRYFPALQQKCASVVYPGVDARYKPATETDLTRVRGRYTLPDRYVLYVGSNKPHKNLVRLMEAWALLNSEGVNRDTCLVVAGYWDHRYPEARKLALKLDLGEKVRFIGPADEYDLPALYSGARLFVFPSLYEGFGFPILEAMACGTAVVCSDTSSLPEVVGDGAISFDPRSSNEVARAIRDVLVDSERQEHLKRAGIARASQFTWEKAARETLAIYHNVLAANPI
jgi:alpha-1,3-rhamnosyl/mannosyltransferase